MTNRRPEKITKVDVPQIHPYSLESVLNSGFLKLPHKKSLRSIPLYRARGTNILHTTLGP